MPASPLKISIPIPSISSVNSSVDSVDFNLRRCISKISPTAPLPRFIALPFALLLPARRKMRRNSVTPTTNQPTQSMLPSQNTTWETSPSSCIAPKRNKATKLLSEMITVWNLFTRGIVKSMMSVRLNSKVGANPNFNGVLVSGL